MGVKLRLLSWWTPNFIIRRMLNQVDAETARAFQSLPIFASNEVSGIVGSGSLAPSGSVEQQRTAMASAHVKLVDLLVSTLGQEKGVEMGRAALFEVGKRIGGEVRRMLGVSDKPADLIRAAKVLYRVLGIDFAVQWTGKETATLIVNRCALAKAYSELTCKVLSATDEGVMQGLNPDARMHFKEHITGGCPTCKADILFTREMQKQ